MALVCAAWGAASAAASASTNASANASTRSPRLCTPNPEASAAQQDRRLRFAAEVRAQLEASGARLALVARSGVDLERFGQRYSHAGVSLRASPNTPWSVRQLYYACDEGRPHLFDQGLAGFLLAADDLPGAHVSLLLLPPEAEAALERTALDNARALDLLAADYSANAYAFGTRYQNCNQWLIELLASAWGEPPDTTATTADGAAGTPPAARTPETIRSARARAQQWLAAAGYQPHRFEAPSRLLYELARAVPLLHHDDHPEADRAAAVFHVSMPAAVERFVTARLPAARRIELCHDETKIVVRTGGAPLGAGCVHKTGDAVIWFSAAEPPRGPTIGAPFNDPRELLP